MKKVKSKPKKKKDMARDRYVMRSCPLCGAYAEIHWRRSDVYPQNRYTISCSNLFCNLTLYGSTIKRTLINRWNKRA